MFERKYPLWCNGEFKGEFDLSMAATDVLERDGFGLIVPRNMIVRRWEGELAFLDLGRPEFHLPSAAKTVLADGLLKQAPGVRFPWAEIADIGGSRAKPRNARSLASRWMGQIRYVVQDGRFDIFIRLDRYHHSQLYRYAWYLDPCFDYFLIDTPEAFPGEGAREPW
ncbi:MAG: hypothetical protein ACP5HU_08730 [Phycisphaerae bacterium]